MTIVLTGGGSGGHITPILAVAAELKRLQPDAKLVYIGQRGDKLGDIPAADPNIDAVFTVRAGKFRRYHSESWRQFLDVPTMVKNIRDASYVLLGLLQSYRLLRRLQPDVIFIKGGFVGVPVGLAAARLNLPFITHDSDAIPGLANRIVSRWAVIHAVALPADVYSYPAIKTVTTGIPISQSFVPITNTSRAAYREELGLPADAQVVFVIGGGLGAQRINKAVVDSVAQLMDNYPNLYLLHSVGRDHEISVSQQYAQTLDGKQLGRVQVFGYINDVWRYSGAADVIITRAGATNLAEFAAQAQACIVVPSPYLTGGHQLKNAQYLADIGAALVLQESDLVGNSNRLLDEISELLRSPAERHKFGQQLLTFARPDAAKEIATLLLKTASEHP